MNVISDTEAAYLAGFVLELQRLKKEASEKARKNLKKKGDTHTHAESTQD